jgi:hypothetical protein
MNWEEQRESLVGWYGGFDRNETDRQTGKKRLVSYRGLVKIQVKPGMYVVYVCRKEPVGRLNINNFRWNFNVSCSQEYLTVEDFIEEKWEWRQFVGEMDWDLFRWDHPWNVQPRQRIYLP